MKFSQSASKYYKLFCYIQYNFAGEKNVHQVHIQDIRNKKFFDVDILPPCFSFFFFFSYEGL